MKPTDPPQRALLLFACLWATCAFAAPAQLPGWYSTSGLTTLAAACAGGVGAFAYYAEKSRSRLFGMALVNAFLAVCAVVIVPLWLGWGWVNEATKATVEPPLAFVFAFALRWGVPLAIEVGPQWVKRKWGAKPSENRDEVDS